MALRASMCRRQMPSMAYKFALTESWPSKSPRRMFRAKSFRAFFTARSGPSYKTNSTRIASLLAMCRAPRGYV